MGVIHEITEIFDLMNDLIFDFLKRTADIRMVSVKITVGWLVAQYTVSPIESLFSTRPRVRYPSLSVKRPPHPQTAVCSVS